MPLALLNNQVVFKKLFQDPEIIIAFVKDLIGIELTPTTIEVEKQFTPPIGAVDFQIDVFKVLRKGKRKGFWKASARRPASCWPKVSHPLKLLT